MNLLQFFTCIDRYIQEGPKTSFTPKEDLEPIFQKIKGTFFELIYQLEKSSLASYPQLLNTKFKQQVTEIKTIIGLIFEQILKLFRATDMSHTLLELDKSLDQIEKQILQQNPQQFKKSHTLNTKTDTDQETNEPPKVSQSVLTEDDVEDLLMKCFHIVSLRPNQETTQGYIQKALL